ncbi:MAG: glycosyltransferase family 39 protein [Victivallales bacterium]|nr:glycosyltransferase family 39 protein [Victivallales bacterium]
MKEGNTAQENIKISLLVFWVLAVAMMFVELGGTILWGSEDRWAEISRMMLLSGDWWHPCINGDIYFDKPLLSYWMITIPGLIVGYVDEFIIRLPSALAGLAGLWGTYVLGKKLWNRKVALAACWILLSASGFIFWSRKGAADMENMAAIILAVAWYFQCRDKAGFFSYFLFFFICIAGAHTKGLPAIIVPLAAIAPDLIRHNNWKKHFKVSFFAAGIICAVLYFVPFVIASMAPLPQGWEYPAGQLTGLELVWRENIMRAFNSYDHNDEPFFSYLYHIPRLMIPWTLLLVAALAAMIPRYRKFSDNNRWLLEVILIILLLFTASDSKRWYYILPIMPFCSLCCGVFIFENLRENWKRWTFILYKYVAIICGMVLLFTIPVYRIGLLVMFKLSALDNKHLAKLSHFYDVEIHIGWQIALTLTGILALAPWLLLKRNNAGRFNLNPILGAEHAKWAALMLSVWALMFGGMCIFPGTVEQFRTEKDFALELAEVMKKRQLKPADVAFFLKASPAIIFYAGFEGPATFLIDETKDGVEISAEEKYRKWLKTSSKGRLLISQERYIERLQEFIPAKKLEEAVLHEKTFPWDYEKKPKKRKNVLVFQP